MYPSMGLFESTYLKQCVLERIKRPGDSVPWRFFLYKSSGLTGKTKTPLTIRNNWILAYEYSRIVNTAPIKRHDQYFLISFFSYQWHVYLFWPFPEECFRFSPNPDGLFEIVRWGGQLGPPPLFRDPEEVEMCNFAGLIFVLFLGYIAIFS